MVRLLLSLVPVALLCACHNGAFAEDGGSAPALSGQIATRDFPARGFDAVALQGSDNVTVAIGPAFAVRASGDRSVLDQLEIGVERGTLKIGRKRGAGGWWSDAGKRGHATIAVTLPALKGATVAGSGDMRVGALRSAAFAGTVAGSGDLDLASLDVQRADLTVGGSGDLVAAGRTRSGDYSIAGSGRIAAATLAAETLSLTVAGSGDLAASARAHAKVSMIGSGDVTVTGGAQCDVTKVGSGDVTCG